MAAAIRTLERMYSARTPFMTVGSSKGIFLPTCIIPRMMIRLVLDNVSCGCSTSAEMGFCTFVD